MSSGLNHKRFSNCNAVDMSSSAITSRLREVSQLHQLGLSLANAKPMVTLPRSVDKTDAMPLKVQADSVSTLDGVRLDWADGWLLLRSSNTEPLVRLIAEAPDKQSAEDLIRRAKSLMENV